ncbi:MAG: 50S ribosomal protein L10 [Bacteroidaceae bacterium]|jgi:large subunit ribosomal protein L10|nr:50S ribosomal protein L10 [Bacteroidaceae bacterium]MBQ5714651.1 50S ribosomal protein L10 [Bacteroidaceae bacterium]
MRKEDKIAIIAQLGELLKQYPHFYLVDVEGMNAASTSSLRRRCFESGLKMVVVKNTLMIKALEAAEQDFDELKPVLVGTTALLLTETANVPAKLIKELNSKKQEKPAFKAAYAEGALYVGADQLNTLAALKSKNELIADVIAALESPIMNVLNALENREEKAEEAAAE